jgi:sulfatase maturation enzyme AslB (radical SAM superfamily)
LNSTLLQKNFSFKISTNGLLVTEKILQKLKKSLANIEIAFSID